MKKILLILFFILLFINLFGQKKLLLLYKNSEQYGEYMFKYHIIPLLEKYDIDYALSNIEDINYYKINNKDYFGIISWYYSPTLENSNLYLRQLSSFVENGGFFFFFNNLGVTSDIREVNNLLNKLGIHYMYDYKDINNYNINFKKDFFITSPSTNILQPVEKYITFGNNDIILSYISNNESYPMIILSNNGGGAIFNSFIDKDGNVIFNIEKLILKLINQKVGTQNKILIIKTNFDDERFLYSQNELTTIFKYAKLNYELINVDEFYNLSYFDLIPYSYIIWNTDAGYIKTKTIERYINNGGTFIFSTNIYNTPWNIYAKVDNIDISKIVFSKNLFPIGNDENGSVYNRNFKISFNLSLNEKHTTLAYLENNNVKIPAIWYEKINNGYIGYIYPYIIFKAVRGLILQSILEMKDTSIAGLLNSFIFYIDDFPLPSYNVEKLVINGKKITDDEYYYEIWWPSIKKFSEKYNIKYTFVTPLSYNGSSTPPFEFTEFFVSKNNYPYKTMREISNSDFELGLHGYNHNSLTKDRWANPENIKLSLKAAIKFISNIIGHDAIISSYVAPNNLIDEFGINNLLQAIPTIKTVGTIYEDNSYLSEYEIRNNFTIIIPRSTYGYYPLSKVYLTTINTLANFGTFQHFIHSDDVFSKDRNPKNLTWDQMYNNLETFYNTIKNKFPWLRNQTASEAYPFFFDYLTQDVKYEYNENNLTVIIPDSSLFPKFFMIKSKMNIRKISGGKIIHYYRDNNLYIIEMNKNILNIEFLR
ncbi:DUF2194 domain-containing protein [Marinitoga sp. 38H-ov]|uniref:DUF2194 domain-containing protein n=1 Tax=Marinitoga sp. 38H-ov TaxID=1755814 RepID=UPI0013EBA16A|nr:DUF2194 domain-containing protein [Marinitoga sp. 38H-ov]KAF2955660.1 hypothetical protein AS160_00675 [Marinitoga sp. 38H-ov]